MAAIWKVAPQSFGTLSSTPPCPGEELSGVVAAAVGLPARRPLVAPSPDELGRLLVEQRVERLLDGLPHQILYVLAQRLLVD